MTNIGQSVQDVPPAAHVIEGPRVQRKVPDHIKQLEFKLDSFRLSSNITQPCNGCWCCK